MRVVLVLVSIVGGHVLQFGDPIDGKVHPVPAPREEKNKEQSEQGRKCGLKRNRKR